MTWRVCLLIFSAAFALAERCDPPRRVAEVVRALPDRPNERRAAIARRLESDPNDFWLNRLLLDTGFFNHAPVREKYRREFEAHPESLDDAFLYARSLVGADTKQALKIYASILERDAEYPWVRYSQLEIYRSPVFRDREKLRENLDALVRVCPAWIEPYRFLTDLNNSDLAPGVARLRELLETSKNPEELKLYTTLWSAEFRIRPKDDRDAERQLIAADLARLQQFDGVDAVIANGAKLIGDDALAKKLNRRPDRTLMVELNEWQKAHPYPPANDPEKQRSFGEAQLEASNRWIEIAPYETASYSQRLEGLLRTSASLDQIAKAGDDVTRVARENGNQAAYTFADAVAASYVQHGILLDRVPAITEEVLAIFDEPEELDFMNRTIDAFRAERRMDMVARHVGALVTLSECYEKQGDLSKARAVLAPIPAFLKSQSVSVTPSPATVTPLAARSFAYAHTYYWQRLAALDSRENKKDAINDYREAVLAWPLALRSDLLEKQRRLWKELGKSDEAWQAWIDSIPKKEGGKPQQTGFAAVHRPLPDVVLKDLEGNSWPVDRFQHKTTIAVVWATWCGPCVSELPFFAKLAERFKDRTDVQVVSFDIDENRGLIEPFMSRNGYKFPVLLAQDYADRLMPWLSIPRTWIIRDGAIVEEEEGFGGSGEQWMNRIAAKVESR